MAYVRVDPVAAGDAPAITEYNQIVENLEALKNQLDSMTVDTYTEHSVLIGDTDGSITMLTLGAGDILVGRSGQAPMVLTPTSSSHVLQASNGVVSYGLVDAVAFSEADRWGV